MRLPLHGSRVIISVSMTGDRFVAKMSGPKDLRTSWRHMVARNGGKKQRAPNTYAFRPIDIVSLAEECAIEGAVVIPEDGVSDALSSCADIIDSIIEATRARSRRADMAARPYQVEGAEFLAIRRRALLADQMGLGKTIQALIAMPPGHRVIVVCPAVMRMTWLAESEKWRPDYDWAIAAREPIDVEAGHGLIMSPERMTKMSDEEIERIGDSHVVVADEAHYYKNRKSKRSQAMERIVDRSGYAWAMTGTPMTDKPPDIVGVLSTFQIFERAFATRWRFDKLFGIEFDRRTGIVSWPPCPPEPDEIVECLERVSIRRSRSDVLPEIPDKSYGEILVDITDPKARASIPETTQKTMDAIRLVDKGGLDDLPFESFSNFADLRAALAEAKINVMMSVVHDFIEQGESLVVCSVNTAPLRFLYSAGHPVITGRVPADERMKIVDRFQSSKDLVIGIQTQAGGVGITLTRAHHMLMVQREWIPTANTQAEDRICRYGQTQPCVIYDLIANHPLDEIISRAIRDKSMRIESTVNRIGCTVRTGERLAERMRELAEFARG